MKIDTFQSERLLSLWQNQVKFDFTETGVHPLYLNELVSRDELDELYQQLHLRYIQTDGIPALKDAICDLYPGCQAANILVTNGSAEANFLTLWRMVEPGDEVVAVLPNYLQVPGIARSMGATLKTVYLREEFDWGPDLGALYDAVTDKTRLIYLTNPNNPTGAVLSDADIEIIISIADRVGAWILADEVYRGAELDGELSTSFWGSYPRVLISSGLSKAYTLPGIRIGWLLGPPEAIAETWGYHDYTTITTGALNSELACVAMRPETRIKILKRNREISYQNLTGFQNWLQGHPDLFRMVPPKIGGVCFLGYDLEINSTQLVEILLREHSLLIVPGDYFGLDGYVRIGYGASNLLEGMDLIFQTILVLREENPS